MAQWPPVKSTGDTLDAVEWNQIIGSGLNAVDVIPGLFSALHATPEEGDTLIQTDAPLLHYYHGVSPAKWHRWYRGVPITLPVDADWSDIPSAAPGSISTTRGVIDLSETGGAAAHDLRGRQKALPTAPYKIDFGVEIALGAAASTTDTPAFFAGWREAASGELHVAYLRRETAEAIWQRSMHLASLTAVPAAAGEIISGEPVFGGPVHYIRCEDDATDRIIYVSPDGFGWTEIAREAVATFLTPDLVVFGVDRRATTGNRTAKATLFHYSES